MRKKIVFSIVCALAVSMPGCANVSKKFIHQKPKPEHTTAVVYIEKGPYLKKFSNEYYYKMHYSLWKTWQDEILDNLGGNSKKLQRSAEEAVSNLDQMGQYLNAKKQTELKAVAEELTRFTDKIGTGGGSHSEQMNMRSDLERLKRKVANNFNYERVKEDLLPDNVDLGAGAAKV